MKKLPHLLVFSWLLLAAAACTQASQPVLSTPDQDVRKLAELSEPAARLARKQTSGPVLHQVDTDLKTFTFRFTDQEATKELSVFIPDTAVPPEQWTTQVNEVTPLVGNTSPGLNLGKLRAGPNRAAKAVLAHWPGYTIRSLTLYSADDHLTWVAFCNTPQGVVVSTMDGENGVFTPSAAPPASLPGTATPLP